MKYPPLPTLLNELPPTQESIEKLRETVSEIQEDIDTSKNLERVRVLNLNKLTCLKRIKEIENK